MERGTQWQPKESRCNKRDEHEAKGTASRSTQHTKKETKEIEKKAQNRLIVCWQTVCPNGDVCFSSVLVKSNPRLRQYQRDLFTKRPLPQKKKKERKEKQRPTNTFLLSCALSSEFQRDFQWISQRTQEHTRVLLNFSNEFLFMYLTLAQTLAFLP